MAQHADAYASARALVALLRGPSHPRTRSGIVRLAPKYFGLETDVAAHLGADCESIANRVFQALPTGASWVPLDAMTVLGHLDNIAGSNRGSECVLVTHLDLLLAKLDENGREHFWDSAYKSLPHRPRVVLLAIPYIENAALHLGPQGDQALAWQESGRLVGIGI